MKTKILIVDDLRENIVALSELIASNDVEILTAETPDRALDLLLDHEFALALLDVMMPTMSGFELARLIRGVERSRHLPIIFVTAHQMEQSVIFEGYESGAVDVLFKPLDPHIVRSKVRVFVRLDQQSKLLQAQVQTMARLKEEAESANVAKSRFLANMSHEIRTPLSAVLGFADVLSQGGLSVLEREESLASISRNGKLLLRIIDDILDLSRIEAQRMELERIAFDLGDALRDLETTLSNKATDKGIALEFTRGEGADGRYVSDPLRLKQVLLNVIGNAIKFTNKGSVRVHAVTSPAESLVPNGPVQRELKFVIEDTGIGLTQDEARRIFEPFAQADGSTRRKFGGTGLGLAIAKQLARSMGGDVSIERTKPGDGSTFVVSIRAEVVVGKEVQADGAQAPAKAPQVADGASGLSGKRVLVVDDVMDNRILIERYLKPAGVVVGTAAGGQEAIERAKASEWDLVLMDIQMPNMDGYEATSQLRRIGFEKPIIALTAHAMREELERCMKAGCDSTLTKPITRRDLIAKITDVLVQ